MPRVATVARKATTVAIRMVRFPRILPRVVGPRRRRLTGSGAERRLGDFPERVAREGVQVAHLTRALVRRQQPGDVVGQLALAGTVEPVFDHDPGDDPLAEVGVGLAG